MFFAIAKWEDHRRHPLFGVVELGELIAGPFIGTLLAEFGAEVMLSISSDNRVYRKLRQQIA